MYLKKDKNPWQSKRPALPDLEKMRQVGREKVMQWQWIQKFRTPAARRSLLLYGGTFLMGLWLLTGIYIIDEGERGVIRRFGAYQKTVMPGPHWHWPWPVERVTNVNVESQRFVELGYRSTNGRLLPVPSEALMLTGDENIVEVHLAIQYQIKDANDYLFNVQQPEKILKQVAESVTRGVIGRQKMDYVLTEGRTEIVAQIEHELQRILDDYRAGIQIASVNLQDAQPPEEVQRAFEDAIKAREDKQRLINEAQAYANEIIPIARGKSARIVEEARAYEQSVVSRAEGETDRFRQILASYRVSPKVTRRRLAIEGMTEVLSKTNVVMMDMDAKSSVVYLPLEQLRNVEPAKLSPKPGQTHTYTSNKEQPTKLRSVHRSAGRNLK